jgi:ankyrin repeat protein
MRLTEANRTTLNSFLAREGFPVIAENVEEAQLRTFLTTARNNKGEFDKTIHRASGLGNIDIINIILNCGIDVNQARTEDGATPLYIAAYKGQLNVAQLLLDRGAEVNQAETNGATPLYIAAALGQLDVAKLLLDRGAKVNQAEINGVTPLYIAAQEGQLDVAKLLLKRGAEVNLAETNGATPLFIAAEEGQLAIAELLLDRGAKVNQAMNDGATPLLIAALEGQLAVAKLLLDRGANVNQPRTTDGVTPLHIAAQQGHTTVTLLLKLAGAKRGAIDFDTNDEVIKQALKASAMLEIITQRFPASATDLHRAIEATLDNITNIGNLLSFNQGLEKKFNKIIHPSSTADISHMVNQFLPGKLPDALIGKIANPEIENLAEHDLRGTKNTGAIVAQIITNRLQEQAVQALAQAAAEVVIARAQSKQNCSSNFADRVEKRAEKDSTQGR